MILNRRDFIIGTGAAIYVNPKMANAVSFSSIIAKINTLAKLWGAIEIVQRTVKTLFSSSLQEIIEREIYGIHSSRVFGKPFINNWLDIQSPYDVEGLRLRELGCIAKHQNSNHGTFCCSSKYGVFRFPAGQIIGLNYIINELKFYQYSELNHYMYTRPIESIIRPVKWERYGKEGNGAFCELIYNSPEGYVKIKWFTDDLYSREQKYKARYLLIDRHSKRFIVEGVTPEFSI